MGALYVLLLILLLLYGVSRSCLCSNMVLQPAAVDDRISFQVAAGLAYWVYHFLSNGSYRCEEPPDGSW